MYCVLTLCCAPFHVVMSVPTGVTCLLLRDGLHFLKCWFPGREFF